MITLNCLFILCDWIHKRLLDNELDESMMMCSVQPTNVENNVVFVVDLGKLEVTKDLNCDNMGAWKHNGVYHSWVEVDDLGFVLVWLMCIMLQRSTSLTLI